jgi:predicted nucleic acid-binding protein
MAQVIDASIAVGWCARSQANFLTSAALEAVSRSGAHVPASFWYEVLNVLLRLERRGIVRRTEVDDFLTDVAMMNFVVEDGIGMAAMANLHRVAREHSLRIFDATYLDLAARRGLPLATRDASLARAAEMAGVPLFTA